MSSLFPEELSYSSLAGSIIKKRPHKDVFWFLLRRDFSSLKL